MSLGTGAGLVHMPGDESELGGLREQQDSAEKTEGRSRSWDGSLGSWGSPEGVGAVPGLQQRREWSGSGSEEAALPAQGRRLWG